VIEARHYSELYRKPLLQELIARSSHCVEGEVLVTASDPNADGYSTCCIMDQALIPTHQSTRVNSDSREVT
jgi:hypothetical protein